MESIIHSHLLLLPMGRDRKIRTTLRTNQIAGFITVPSEKKINVLTVCALLIFIVSQCPSPKDMTKYNMFWNLRMEKFPPNTF